MRIAIVNDLLLATEALRRLLASDGRHTVAWIAHDGEEAVARCAEDRPDLILMDLQMPRLDGIEATRRIMAQSPCAILVVTATPDDCEGVFRAMGAGALDVTATPALAGGADGGALLRKIGRIEPLVRLPERPTQPALPQATAPVGTTTETPGALVAIGASTGGPAALVSLFEGWAPTGAASVVLVQHIDRRFAPSFIAWLGSQIAWPVTAAAAGAQPQPGQVCVALGDDHLLLDGRGRFAYTDEPLDYPYRPSVDVFFASLAGHPHLGRQALGILLTGMGRDGANGLYALRQSGCPTLAQDEASCAVYGMPAAAVRMGAAERVLSPAQIGAWLQRRFASPPGGRT
ncbi:chemotaxis-specific protein-glutamate methyltransferase CheB [Pseudomonas sp. EpS/L25]|uniref:chemotaxis-specific protein-glutamate methyltransferase CheB n=1 Tax=Pseudomonas sp. EpS/L25 TaxID=1749078 RepID=UPI0007438CFD|nr:chemotaxis-specific protein-glutamate methyltransferase CheB [Pseudomonas sp. EpS/L25]KUM43488.1 chemotaxis response regulator protein-glutamate methylesterase [Pseudomonas sp. EpS/L25]